MIRDLYNNITLFFDRRACCLCGLLLFTSCYDSFERSELPQSSSPRANCTIEHIHNLYAEGMRDIKQPLIVEGRVTANDEAGNFFRSFVVQSDGFALEVLDGLYDSYVRHPLGARVVVTMQGLSLEREMGLLRAGLTPEENSFFDVEYLTSEALVDRHISVVALEEEVECDLLKLTDLEESTAGRLVAIERLQLVVDDGLESSWSGFKLFRDEALDSIWCYTSPYANFAEMVVPSGSVQLSGLLEFGEVENFGGRFVIRMRDESDCIVY